jgi:hypothetical protein
MMMMMMIIIIINFRSVEIVLYVALWIEQVYETAPRSNEIKWIRI